ncbi:MAG TPA: SdpI family protein, partial [Flavisolibacter sp.]|nr:SdpI family protein [Flavisolibacter sp.]
GWSSRESLWLIPASLPLGFYFLFLLLPLIDPKQKLRSGTGKFEHIRSVLVLFLAGLACMTLYISKNQSIQHLDKFLFAFMGLFVAALGNFFPSLKANYFIGIRSPWTLESEAVWKKTHQFAGKLWVGGGLLVMALALTPGITSLGKIIVPLMLFLTLVPFFYSFILWRRLKKETPNNMP